MAEQLPLAQLTPRPVVFANEEGRLYLVRCPICDLENYAIRVASGTCFHCGYVATTADLAPAPSREEVAHA